MIRKLATSHLSGLIVTVAGLAIVLTVLSPGFTSAFNLNSILATLAVTGLVGIAQASVLSIGQFNIALPGMGAYVALMLGWLLQTAGLPLIPAIALAIAFGALLGAVQGVLISRFDLNAFIVTLGLASVYYSLMFITVGNQQFQHLPASLGAFGRGSIGPVPLILLASVVVAMAFHVFAQRTATGRELLATGASPVVAFYSGIRTGRIVILAHAMSGGLAAVAATLLVARLGSAQPAVGQDWLLASFAAPVLGGTLLSGGRMSAAGTYLGALLLAMVGTALVVAGVSPYWYQAGVGLFLLGAVLLDRARSIVAVRGERP